MPEELGMLGTIADGTSYTTLTPEMLQEALDFFADRNRTERAAYRIVSTQYYDEFQQEFERQLMFGETSYKIEVFTEEQRNTPVSKEDIVKHLQL